jgi:hypothetical protein
MSQVYPNRDLVLSKHASMQDYSIPKHKQQFLMPSAETKELKPINIDNSSNNNNITNNTTNTTQTSSNSLSSSSSSIRTEPFRFTDKPFYPEIKSSGPRTLEAGPYKSRLPNTRSSSSEEKPKRVRPIKLYVHESAIKREFYTHGTHNHSLW